MLHNASFDAPQRWYVLRLPIGWRVCARQRIASNSMPRRFSSERFLSLPNYDDIDNSELEGRSNERISYVFGGEPKFDRERYIRVAATVIVIIAGITNICV